MKHTVSLLESLDISHNSVEDISEIANTTALKINLGHNPFPKNQLEILKSKAALQILLVSSFKINNPADRYDRYPGESIPDFLDRVLLERLCHLKRCDTSSGYIRCEFVSVDCYPGTCNEETDTCDCPSGFVEDSFIEVFWEFNPDIGCVLVDTGVECEDDEHLGDNNACMKNELKKSCDEDEEITLSDKQEWYSGKEKFTEIWNETTGAYEPVYNSSCFGKRADESCDPENSENECLWRCIEGYTYDETDEECKPTATKEIWGSMINSFGRTQITRRDFAYEQHKDEIGFTPELFLSYGTNSEEWQTNIPYAKIGTNILTGYMFGGYLEELDFSAVSISLGTSIERYTNEFDTKYYQCGENEDAESNFLENYPNSECEITGNENEADWIVKKYYAEPGSRNYGYAELLYHKNWQEEPLQNSCIEEGCFECLYYDGTPCEEHNYDGTPCEEHSDCQECLTDSTEEYYDTHIKILRHGSDGSKMVFKSTAPRASGQSKKNKPIPVRKIQTRTNREVSFDYHVSAKSFHNDPYAIYDSVVITDSLERTIDVSLKNYVAPESGLEGLLPDNWQNQRSNLGLFGRESTHTGYKAEGAQLLTIKGMSDNHYVKYIINRNSSSLSALIYKDQELYRTDSYDSETNTVTIDVNKTERKERYFRCNENADWCDNNNEVGYKKITDIDSDTEKKEIVTINTKKQEKDTTPDNISFQQMRKPERFITRKRELYKNDELKKVIREEFSPWGMLMKRTVFSGEAWDENDTTCTDDIDCSEERFDYNVDGEMVYHRAPDGMRQIMLYGNNANAGATDWTGYYTSDTGRLWRRDGKNIQKKAVISADIQDTDFDKEGCVDSIIMHGDTSAVDSCWDNTDPGRKVTHYSWQHNAGIQPTIDTVWDIEKVKFPDLSEKIYTLDYEDQSSNNSFGNVTELKTIGKDETDEHTLYYEYNADGRLAEQGVVENGVKQPGKKFEYSGGLNVKTYNINENDEDTIPVEYVYDTRGRKIAEISPAPDAATADDVVATLYIYDSMGRVAFSGFGCVGGTYNSDVLYTPWDSPGDIPQGSLFYNNEWSCEYFREYEYDVFSNLTQTVFQDIIDFGGTDFWPDTNRRIIQETTYDNVGNPTSNCQYVERNSDAQRCVETEHDIFGNITWKKEEGNIREVEYNYLNKHTKVTENGIVIEKDVVYDKSGRETSLTNKHNETASTTYDGFGRVETITDPFGNIIENIYDESTGLLQEKNTKTEDGTLTGFSEYTYDDLGRKKTATTYRFTPSGGTLPTDPTEYVATTTTYCYDDRGNVEMTFDTDGNAVDTTYDSVNRVKTRRWYTDQSGLACGASFQISDAEKTVTNVYHETSGYLLEKEVTEAEKTLTHTYEYDILGRQIKSCIQHNSEENARCQYRAYSTGGNLIYKADEEASEARNSYFFSDEFLGNETFYSYNAFGEVTHTWRKMTDTGAGGSTFTDNPFLTDGYIETEIVYDNHGRITKRYNDRDGRTEYYYNTAGKLWKKEHYPAPGDTDVPDSQSYEYVYDDKGDLKTTTYAEDDTDILTVTNEYDNFGRVTKKTANESHLTQTFDYNTRNLLETATEGDISVKRHYDSLGSIYKETVTVGVESEADSKTVEKTFSRSGLTTTRTLTYPDGTKRKDTFENGRRESIAYGENTIADYSWDNNMLQSISYGNGTTEHYEYNEWLKLSNLKVDIDTSDIYDTNYDYTRSWKTKSKTGNITNAPSENYDYDSYYRLKKVDYTNGTDSRIDTFTLDGTHNIRETTEGSASYDWQVDGMNRLRGKQYHNDENDFVTWSYDERNNMITEEFADENLTDRTFSYDLLNRLKKVKETNGDTIATYRYDPFNRRIIKTVGNTVHRYSYDGWNVIEEEIFTDENNNDILDGDEYITQRRNFIDTGMDNHIAMEQFSSDGTATMYYFITDKRGNIEALVDDTGTVIERYHHTVYGTETTVYNADYVALDCSDEETCHFGDTHTFGWSGSTYEPETDLYWMRNRYYHPDMKRFINQDPIGIWGDANNLGNGFAYVAGMVIDHTDPTGLKVVGDRRGGLKETGTGPHNFWHSMAFRTHPDVIINMGISTGSGTFAIDILKLMWDNREFFKNSAKHSLDAMSRYVKLRNLSNAREADRKRRKRKTNRGNNSLPENNYPAYYSGSRTPHYFYSPPPHNSNEGEDEDDPEDDNVSKNNKEGQKEDSEEDATPPNQDNKPNSHKKDDEITIIHGNDVGDGSEFVVNGRVDWGKIHRSSMGFYDFYPSSPDDDGYDKVQTIFMQNLLIKILIGSGTSLYNVRTIPDYTPGSAPHNSGGYTFHINPLYRTVEPLKQILRHGNDGTGTPMIHRNPLAPKAAVSPFSSTADKIMNSGFNPGTIDPWFE